MTFVNRFALACLGGLVLAGNAFADAMYIDPTGRVGLGTDTPAADLDVSKVRPFIALSDTGNGRNFKLSHFGWFFQLTGTAGIPSVRVHHNAPKDSLLVRSNGNVAVRGVLEEGSDRNLKQAIEPVDTQEILARVRSVPISEWEYITAPDARHIGPMAQDFHGAFGLGNDNTKIASIDTGGVALASIQALADQNSDLKAENEALRRQIQEQELRLSALEEASKKYGDLEVMVMSLLAEQGSHLANN